MDISQLSEAARTSLYNAINNYIDIYDLPELVLEELTTLTDHLIGADEVLPEEDPIEVFQQGLARSLPSWQSSEHDPYAGDRKPC